MARPRRPLKQAQTVAVGCDRLPESFHGKEGVDGSSPSEGSAKALQTVFVQADLQMLQTAVGVEPFMEPSGRGSALVRRQNCLFALVPYSEEHADARS
jgi:hypothetical protein